ncbi:MAG: response regulator transcription factor [Bacteroidia bacterium]|nr:response regulator transcription factor [Bacteroidia bacterium]
MLRAIIIDDEQRGINTLKLLLERYVPEVKVVADSSEPLKGMDLIESYRPEIVFLDINMPEMDGFELLEKLQWKNFNLIFTTAHQEYALKAIKNNAIDYLLKPIDYVDLKAAVARILKRNAQHDTDVKFNYSQLIQDLNQKQRILINSRSGVEAVDLDEIICMESESNYTTVFLVDGKKITTAKTLKEFEGQLCSENSHFMRVHQSYIINLKKVQRFVKTDDMIVLDEELQAPLSKSRRDLFFKWMNV